MPTILHITASIRGADSISRSLSQKLADKLATEQGANIIERDLSQSELHFISSDSFAAVGTPKDERSTQQQELAKLSDTLIEELQVADIIVLGIPIYNFSAPASFKAWADLVARGGTTFTYTANGPVGLLENKKAYLVGVSGGTPIGSDIDFMSPWVKFFLGFIGIHDVETIVADGIMGADGEEKIDAAKARIKTL